MPDLLDTDELFVVVDENLRVVYRGNDLDLCSERLLPGKMVGNIFARGFDPVVVEAAAKDKMRELLFQQRQTLRLKAMAE